MSGYEQLPQFLDVQEPQPVETAGPELPWPELLKLQADICLLTFELLHAGQHIGFSLEVTICSNAFPQESHLNSKIGMIYLFLFNFFCFGPKIVLNKGKNTGNLISGG